MGNRQLFSPSPCKSQCKSHSSPCKCIAPDPCPLDQLHHDSIAAGQRPRQHPQDRTACFVICIGNCAGSQSVHLRLGGPDSRTEGIFVLDIDREHGQHKSSTAVCPNDNKRLPGRHMRLSQGRLSHRKLSLSRISRMESQLSSLMLTCFWALRSVPINLVLCGQSYTRHREAIVYNLERWMFWPGCACFTPYFFSSSSVFLFCISILAVTSLPLLFSFLPIC